MATISFRRSNTTISPCAGCELPACIVSEGAVLYNKSPGPEVEIGYFRHGYWTPPAGRGVTYQGGAGVYDCRGVVATRNPTWGGIKSLYR